MKAEPTGRWRYWVRIGCVAAVVISSMFVVVAIGAVGAFLYSGGFNGSEWDSEVEPDAKSVNSTLDAYSFLEHIRGEREVRIKSITPWTFTGSLGHYFVSYSVDLERVPGVIAAWQQRDDVREANVGGPYSYREDELPAWWHDESEAGVAPVVQLGAQERQVHGVNVWCDESKGIFYLFFSWGH